MGMKKRFYLVLLFSLFSVFLYAQGEDTSSIENKDSVYRYQGINPALNINYNLDLFIPFKFSPFNSNKLIEGDKSTLWLRTEIALSYFSQRGPENSEGNSHLLLPFYNQYLEESKFNPIKYILGIAQLSATGYLAYRHIKKYGFWK